MENGFGSTNQPQPCTNGQTGSCSPGLDVPTCEAKLTHSCGTSNVRYELMLDTCGGHAMPYHYHNDLACDYDHNLAGHSPLIGIALDGRGIYGLYESRPNAPANLDACNGHTAATPAFGGSSGTVNPITSGASASVYHYHVTTRAPYTLGCFGPVSSVAQCRGFYSDCGNNGGFETLMTAARPSGYCYDRDCPCYDPATGDNANAGDCNLPVPTTSPTRSPSVSPSFSNQVGTPFFTCPLAACVTTGTYANPLSVRISSPTAGSVIYYTVNGTNPTTNSAQYDGSDIVVNSPGRTTIRALATVTGFANSQIAVMSLNVQGITQQVSATQFTCTSGGTVSACQSGGTYQAPVSIGITTATPASTIHYTIDDTVPTFASTQYVLPIVRSVPGTLTVRAFARQNGMLDSPASAVTINVVATGTPVPNGVVITPVPGGNTNINPTISASAGVFQVPNLSPYVLSGAFTGITAPEAQQTVFVSCTPVDSSLFSSLPTVAVVGTQGRLSLQARRTGSTTVTCTATDNGSPVKSTAVSFTVTVGSGTGTPVGIFTPVPSGIIFTPIPPTVGCNTGRTRQVQLSMNIQPSSFRKTPFGEAIRRSTTQPLVPPYVCVYALCPKFACPNGVCPESDLARTQAGCTLSGQVPSRSAEALQTGSEVIFDFITPLSGSGGDTAQQASYNDLNNDVNGCLVTGTCQMQNFVPTASPRWVGDRTTTDDDDESLSKTWLIIIICLAVLALILIILLIYCCCCRKDGDDCCSCCDGDDSKRRGTDHRDQYGDAYPQKGYEGAGQGYYSQGATRDAYGQGGYDANNQAYAQSQQGYGQASRSMGRDLDGREMQGMQLQPGQKVRALFLDGQVYDATIWDVAADGTYGVQWYDGTYSDGIPTDQITPIN
eukprot:Hpha_TRINITY_DN15056_c0_g4::TRINITY_DN15056_c0_g4_i1::g.126089::m.126089